MIRVIVILSVMHCTTLEILENAKNIANPLFMM